MQVIDVHLWNELRCQPRKTTGAISQAVRAGDADYYEGVSRQRAGHRVKERTANTRGPMPTKFEYRTSDGRSVTQGQFFEHLNESVLDLMFDASAEKVHAAAASIVDPATGKHADVFVRRIRSDGWAISTKGSPDFARELERRLGVGKGEIHSMNVPAPPVPVIYLAHASEDHETLGRPLAEKLLEAGCKVWFDEWEILAGDSIRRKMDEGLKASSHFLVLLTKNSLGKPWVETEIDAGFVRMVNQEARFVGLRVGIELAELSPFLQTLRCPAIDVHDDAAVARLVAELHGVSRKPERGQAPSYVKSAPTGLLGWSPAAILVAEHLVKTSKLARIPDPHTTIPQVAAALFLPEDDVRIAVLDLEGAGCIERSKSSGEERFWPTGGLFADFDRHFFNFDNEKDAVALATLALNSGRRQVKVDDLAAQLPTWEPRRLNSALHYLEGARVIEPFKTIGQRRWVFGRFLATDHTLRFVRDHS